MSKKKAIAKPKDLHDRVYAYIYEGDACDLCDHDLGVQVEVSVSPDDDYSAGDLRALAKWLEQAADYMESKNGHK